MHFQCWSLCHQSQKYGHVPSTRDHSVACGQLSAFTSGIKQCIFQRYLFVSFCRTYYGHILSHRGNPGNIFTEHTPDNYLPVPDNQDVTMYFFFFNLTKVSSQQSDVVVEGVPLTNIVFLNTLLNSGPLDLIKPPHVASYIHTFYCTEVWYLR